MAAVRTFTLPHYEAYPVQVALFQDVSNTHFLRSQLLAANPEFDYAFLDAAMVSAVPTFALFRPLPSSISLLSFTNARLIRRPHQFQSRCFSFAIRLCQLQPRFPSRVHRLSGQPRVQTLKSIALARAFNQRSASPTAPQRMSTTS